MAWYIFRRGTLGSTQYCNTLRKIGNYQSTVSKIDKILPLHYFIILLLVKLAWSCIHLFSVFIYLKHVCTICPCILVVHQWSNSQLVFCFSQKEKCIHSTFWYVYTKQKACSEVWAWPVLDRKVQMNCTAILWRNFCYWILSGKMMKDSILKG